VKLDPTRVPSSLRSLLGPARRWGISDDGYRWEAVEAASSEELDSIAHAVDSVAEDEVYDWLAGPAADASPTVEYVAITCLTMAADHARHRLGIAERR